MKEGESKAKTKKSNQSRREDKKDQFCRKKKGKII